MAEETSSSDRQGKLVFWLVAMALVGLFSIATTQTFNHGEQQRKNAELVRSLGDLHKKIDRIENTMTMMRASLMEIRGAQMQSELNKQP